MHTLTSTLVGQKDVEDNVTIPWYTSFSIMLPFHGKQVSDNVTISWKTSSPMEVNLFMAIMRDRPTN